VTSAAARLAATEAEAAPAGALRSNGARKNFGFATFEDEEGLRRTVRPPLFQCSAAGIVT
jgi:hypothetical protein